MINAEFVEEVKREKKLFSLVGTIIKREHMVFFHLHETFYSIGVQYEVIGPNGTTILEKF